MAKIKKILSLPKKCIDNPQWFGKGMRYIRHYGVSAFVEKVRLKTAGYIPPDDALEASKPDVRYEGEIKFSIVMPVYNVEIQWLEKAIESVRRQNYTNWELCIADDCSTDRRVPEYLKTVESDKILVTYQEKNGGISEATNAAAALASGDYMLLMDNDDEITYDALYEFYRAVTDTEADIIYSDMDIMDKDGNRSQPLYKPDWSYDLMLSQMYVGHLLGFKRSLFEQTEGFRTAFNGSQDYDLFLRMMEKAEKIYHVPKVLYSWRALPSSTAANPESKPYAQTAGLNAIQEHLDRTCGRGKATVKETENLFVYDVRYTLERKPKISVIIPTKDHVELLKDAIDSIYDNTAYPDFEIIILNNNSREDKTFEYFSNIQKEHENIRIIEAPYEFNWSKLNNHGMREAAGEVYIFLNNDVKILTSDWMERLAEKAVLERVGVVGGLLLYEDDTIQHAGVIVGMGGWADHVFKGMKPIHHGSPFISPLVTRNVTACTGALIAVSKATIEKIGGFDEDFIICGSDIELCIRAYYAGFNNIYDPNVKLYHYESKSRDSYIPDVDFKLSYEAYRTYREEGDPFYNENLDYTSPVPKVAERENQFNKRESDRMKAINAANSKKKMSEAVTQVAEITPFLFRKCEFPEKRLNLLVPSLNPEHVFGGISTALKFFDKLAEESGFALRMIITDAAPHRSVMTEYGKKGYKFVTCEKNSSDRMQIVAYNDRFERSIPVSENDIFMFTGWWTAYSTQDAYVEFEKKEGIAPNPFIYFIQDYEPGFYPWSTRYLLADSTYRSEYKQIAVFNSGLLSEFFKQNQYEFYREFDFDPVLNGGLKKVLEESVGEIRKKKQILVYGRPSVERNAFNLLVAALKKWVDIQEDIEEWEILSAGEYHLPVELGKGKELVSVGKLTIEQYGHTMLDSFAGISLMSSPHPSYPPLEMSVFGVKVITNTYANKDLASFNDNMVSLSNISPNNIAVTLKNICDNYKEIMDLKITNPDYVENENIFNFVKEIADLYRQI